MVVKFDVVEDEVTVSNVVAVIDEFILVGVVRFVLEMVEVALVVKDVVGVV